MKQYFASFITKPLKYKICSNLAAASDNLKTLHISAVFIFGQYQYPIPGNVYFLSKFYINEFCLADFYFRAFGPSRMRDYTLIIVY